MEWTDLLQGAANVVDTPWGVARTAMAGRDPFAAILDPSQRASGRDVLESWGMLDPKDEEEGFGWGDLAGMGLEMADPISGVLMGGIGAAALKGARGLMASRAMAGIPMARMASEAMPAASNAIVQGVEHAGIPLLEDATRLIKPEPLMLPAPMAPVPKAPMPIPSPSFPATPEVIPMAGYAPPTYSRLQRAAETLPENVKLESLPNLLKKAPEGVADEQLNWVLGDMPKKGVAKKADIVDKIKADDIKVQEKWFEHSPDDAKQWADYIHDDIGLEFEEFIALSSEEQHAIQQQFLQTYPNAESASLKAASRMPPKWERYKVPGGDDYKEVLFKLKTKPTKTRTELFDEVNDLRHQMISGKIPPEKRDEWAKLVMKLEDQARNTPVAKQKFISDHWEEDPNTFAHARFDTRIGPNGEKILFVNEIQSDWHQTGAKYGYSPEENAKLLSGYRNDISELKKTKKSLFGERDAIQGDAAKSNAINRQITKVVKNIKSLKYKFNSVSSHSPVPDAPFKDKEWSDLVIKQLIRYASENGFDGIALTNGKLAAQYSAGGAKGKTAKGIAEWYDKTLPNQIAKYHGLKMEPIDIPIYHEADEAKNNLRSTLEFFPFFRITPQIKSKALNKGFPMMNLLPPIAAAGALRGAAAYNNGEQSEQI